MTIIKPRVLLVTDPAFGDEATARCVRCAAAALPTGALAVQLRDKKRPIVGLRLFAHQLRSVTRRFGALLVVNGYADMARDIGADGVHLGSDAGSVRAVRAICGDEIWVSVAARSD